MSINAAIQKISDAGFSLSVSEGRLRVMPFGELSRDQKQFLTDHKPEIIQALQTRELVASQVGNDHPPANDSSEQVERRQALPSDLVRLAICYCTGFYADSPEQVAKMLEDLVAVPDDWHWWRHHLLEKLGIPNEVQCIGCGHCEDTEGNLGRCLKGVPTPGACGLWWMTDLHPCIEFSLKDIPLAGPFWPTICEHQFNNWGHP